MPASFPKRFGAICSTSLRGHDSVNHKFHYDSVKQTQKWLALHQAYSPSRNDPDCVKVYSAAFTAAVSSHQTSRAHVVGLGCGGGQKDTQLLKQLSILGKETI